MNDLSLKLQTLRALHAVVESAFSVTRAAELLHTSQPGISRHLADAEEALGTPFFERRRNRLVGLTPAGAALMPLIDRTLRQLDSLPRVAQRFSSGEAGNLTVATSHTHARYLLPPVIARFIREYPTVALRLRQGFVSQIVGWMESGEADLSVSAAPPVAHPDLAFYPFRELHRIVLTPARHPLSKLPRPTLRDIAAWPIITYDREFAAHAQILRAFEAAQLEPNIALSTSDTDVMKTYALTGLGIAILADSAFDPKLDKGLRAIDARHLFPSTKVHIGLRRDAPIGAHAQRFIELVSPELGRRLKKDA